MSPDYRNLIFIDDVPKRLNRIEVVLEEGEFGIFFSEKVLKDLRIRLYRIKGISRANLRYFWFTVAEVVGDFIREFDYSELVLCCSKFVGSSKEEFRKFWSFLLIQNY